MENMRYIIKKYPLKFCKNKSEKGLQIVDHHAII